MIYASRIRRDRIHFSIVSKMYALLSFDKTANIRTCTHIKRFQTYIIMSEICTFYIFKISQIGYLELKINFMYIILLYEHVYDCVNIKSWTDLSDFWHLEVLDLQISFQEQSLPDQ